MNTSSFNRGEGIPYFKNPLLFKTITMPDGSHWCCYYQASSYSTDTLTFDFNFNQEIKENVLPKSIKKISLWSHCNLINNLPLQIEEVYIKFSYDDTYNKEVNNLPITLKKITIDDEKYLKYITKIPFGCNIVIL
jgi:hypothetical protein